MGNSSRGAGVTYIAMAAGLNPIDIFEVRENSGVPAFTPFGVLNDGIERFPARLFDFDRGIALTYEKRLKPAIFLCIQEKTGRIFSVPACPPDFLIVRVEIRRHLIVDDESDIRAVYTHAEGICGHQYSDGAFVVFVLYGVSLNAIKPRMIVIDAGVLRAQLVMEILTLFSRSCINDDPSPRCPVQRFPDKSHLLSLVIAVLDLIVQIGAIEAVDMLPRFL